MAQSLVSSKFKNGCNPNKLIPEPFLKIFVQDIKTNFQLTCVRLKLHIICTTHNICTYSLHYEQQFVFEPGLGVRVSRLSIVCLGIFYPQRLFFYPNIFLCVMKCYYFVSTAVFFNIIKWPQQTHSTV